MRNLIFLILSVLLCLPASHMAQDADNSFTDDKYTMFTTIYLKPDQAKISALRSGLKAHNEKYHTEGSQTAVVWSVANGPRSGSYVWLRGPHTFTDMDTKLGEDHGPHWGENISKNLNDFGPREFWRRNDKHSVVLHEEPRPIIRVRFYEVNIPEQQGFRMGRLWEQMSETVKSIEGRDFELYNNLFQQGAIGRHFAVVTSYPNWAAIDKDDGFRAAFEKIYGEGSYQTWTREMNDVFRDSYDEFWVLQDL